MIGRLLCWLGWHDYGCDVITRRVDRCLTITFTPTPCQRCGKLETTKE